ncbi:hypothetical protein BD311DRAFT_764236 [Dichomitus squalens]|uniref:F-box domain-containing protein n=1 Tax=Dichomitus squalens TaxID=114155 RepID=A0A4Q9MEC7_9APHY|nr:hypothetical protein BD311DRAFT_764236 [Dichomitus squalens]
MTDVPTNATIKSNSRGEPQLDWDVLHAICDHLTDTSDILSLSSTCTSLRPAAMQRFLSVRPIVLKDARSTCNIHSLIFADKTRRVSHVRALQVTIRDINKPYDPSDVADRLLAIVTCVDRLESFHTSDYIFSNASYTRILPAIVQLTTLRELSIAGVRCDDGASNLVQSIQSSLKILYASFRTTPWSCLDILDTTTSHHAATLEVLHLDWVDFGDNDHSVHQVVTEYPALRSFIINYAEGLPRLACLLRAFPALDRTLAFNDRDDRRRWWDLDDPLICLVRDENMRAQESHRWVALDYVSCEAHIFFALGLQCPIRHAKIIDCSAQTRDYVATALRDSPPRQLTLHIELERGLSVFDGLFPPQLGTALTHLTVILRYSHGHKDEYPADLDYLKNVQWDQFLDTFKYSIAHLPLRCLSLSFCIRFRDDDSVGQRLEPLSETFLCTVRNLPFEDVASRLASAITSLELMHVITYGYMHRDDVKDVWWLSRAFRVSYVDENGGGGRKRVQMAELSTEAMQEMFARENMPVDVENMKWFTTQTQRRYAE